MQLVRFKSPAFFATFTALFLAVTSLFAQADYKLTGTAIRVKTVVFVDVNVYEISHYMKQLPATKSKKAVIDMDTGKKFVWKMRRDVEHEKIVAALKDAYAMNDYKDAAKIAKFVSAFKGELKENATVTIAYDADKKTTTLTTGGNSVSVDGVDFMQATWSIWFGKIDQEKLGNELISKLP